MTGHSESTTSPRIPPSLATKVNVIPELIGRVVEKAFNGAERPSARHAAVTRQ